MTHDITMLAVCAATLAYALGWGDRYYARGRFGMVDRGFEVLLLFLTLLTLFSGVSVIRDIAAWVLA